MAISFHDFVHGAVPELLHHVWDHDKVSPSLSREVSQVVNEAGSLVHYASRIMLVLVEPKAFRMSQDVP